MPGPWTAALVRRRLGEAIQLIERTTARPGPKGPRSCWPAVTPDELDRWWQAQAPEDLAARRNRTMIGATSEEIAEADEALAWIPRFVRHDKARKGLALWLAAEARGASFREATQSAGLGYRTAIRYRDDAIASIVDALNRSRDFCNITHE